MFHFYIFDENKKNIYIYLYIRKDNKRLKDSMIYRSKRKEQKEKEEKKKRRIIEKASIPIYVDAGLKHDLGSVHA